VFSPQEYQLAARVLGLPVPSTAAEQAAAAPMTAMVLKNFGRAAPPAPGFEDQSGIQTGVTRSLNAPPENTQPAYKDQLQHRLQAGVVNEEQDDEIRYLIELITSNPQIADLFLNFIHNLEQQSDEHMNMLSAQRPAEYDMPNYGSNYSLLNAPTNSSIPPSERYQELAL
jgi:hypothetical protein